MAVQPRTSTRIRTSTVCIPPFLENQQLSIYLSFHCCVVHHAYRIPRLEQKYVCACCSKCKSTHTPSRTATSVEWVWRCTRPPLTSTTAAAPTWPITSIKTARSGLACLAPVLVQVWICACKSLCCRLRASTAHFVFMGELLYVFLLRPLSVLHSGVKATLFETDPQISQNISGLFLCVFAAATRFAISTSGKSFPTAISTSTR